MSRRSTSLVLLLAAATLLAGCGSSDADARPSATIRIEQLTVDKPPNPEVAALRFLIVNDTGTDDTLVKVTSEVAGSLTFHQSETRDGMATMIPREQIEVPAGSTVTFAPGGLHVMLEGLHRTLAEGDTFPVTFHFTDAGAVQATATVVPLGSVTADDLEHAHA